MHVQWKARDTVTPRINPEFNIANMLFFFFQYSEGTSEGKSFSLIFPSRKSPTKKPSEKKSVKRNDSSTPFDYDSSMPMYPSVNDSSLKSFKSQVYVSVFKLLSVSQKSHGHAGIAREEDLQNGVLIKLYANPKFEKAQLYTF